MRVSSILLLIFSACLVACVHTVDGVKEREVDKEKELASQIRLGMGYLRIGERDTARKIFNKALAIDGNSAEAVSGLGLVYQMDGEPELAEKNFKRSLKMKQEFPQGHNNYGYFLFANKRYEDAYKQFELAASSVEYRRRADALASLGRTALLLERPDKAESSFEHAIMLDPRQTTALIELAELRFQQQDYANSKKRLDQFDSVSKPTARSLWLGIRIERIFDNKDKEASYALALKNLHPYSKEYLSYKKSFAND